MNEREPSISSSTMRPLTKICPASFSVTPGIWRMRSSSIDPFGSLNAVAS